MYAFIKGAIVERKENIIVVENNGIGFEMLVSNYTLDALSTLGQQVRLHTYYHVREDQATLFGFASSEEKHMFLKLIKISGIGPRMAITILSGISIADLATSILTQDTSLLSKIKGIGKKTAERIVLELKEKVEELEQMGDMAGVFSKEGSSKAIEDACFALTALGISRVEALKLVRKVAKEEDTAEELITKALKSFSR